MLCSGLDQLYQEDEGGEEIEGEIDDDDGIKLFVVGDIVELLFHTQRMWLSILLVIRIESWGRAARQLCGDY